MANNRFQKLQSIQNATLFPPFKSSVDFLVNDLVDGEKKGKFSPNEKINPQNGLTYENKGAKINNEETNIDEFKESEHPRDKSGKFAKKGTSSGGSAQVATASKQKLVIDTPESREVWSRIKSGQFYTTEELAALPVVKQMEAEAKKWKDKYPALEKDMSPERVALRKEIKSDFLKMGSAVLKENGKYELEGPVKKGHEAVIAIGLPASGKSTRVANPYSEKMGAFVFDSDEIKKLIPEFKESLGAAADAVHRESKGIQEDTFAEFLENGSRNGDNLVIPIIGDDHYNVVKKWVAPLEKAGYKVKVKYQDADPVVSQNRSMARAIEEGRIIPIEVMLGYGNKPKDVYEQFKKEGYCEEE